MGLMLTKQRKVVQHQFILPLLLATMILYKRLVTSKQISESLVKRLEKIYENLDPVFLLNDIKEKQASL